MMRHHFSKATNSNSVAHSFYHFTGNFQVESNELLQMSPAILVKALLCCWVNACCLSYDNIDYQSVGTAVAIVQK